MSKEILSTNGEKLGEINLNAEVFGVEPVSYTHLDVYKRQLISNRTNF